MVDTVSRSKYGNLGVGKYVYSYTNEAVQCVDFHKLGQYCITTSKHLLTLYDALAAKERKVVKCTASGVQLARYTHHEQAVLFTSRDRQIHYLSLYDDRFMHHFKGHNKCINSLSMNPKDDSFLSSSVDGKIRLWDLRMRRAQAEMRPSAHMHGKVCAAFDPTGVAFGVSLPDQSVRLYDLRNYSHGPFKTFKDLLTDLPEVAIDRISFSNDGKKLLLSTASPSLLVVDAYQGKTVACIKRESWRHGGAHPLATCFTEDSKHVCTGLHNGGIQFWSFENQDAKSHAKLLCTYNYHKKPVYALQWNPRHLSMVSCGHTTAFWIPRPGKPTVTRR